MTLTTGKPQIDMSDLGRLTEGFKTGAFLHPSAGAPSIVDLARALATLAGCPGLTPTPGAAALADLIGPAEQIVFILADGLGLNLIEGLPNSSFLKKHTQQELRAVFPSTTATGLTSIATGQWPAQHRITGWWTHLPELGEPAAIMQFTTRLGSQPLAQRGITLDQAFPIPSLLAGLERDVLAMFPQALVAGAFSTYFSGNRPRHGYQSFAEAIDLTVQRVQSAGQPTYTYIYTPRIDSAVHSYGLERFEVQAALAELDRDLERLAVRLPSNCRLVLTADHGFLDVHNGSRHQLRNGSPLLAYLRTPPSGDARVMYLHARPGAEEAIGRYFQERFHGRFMLITVDEAEAIGLFGPAPIPAETRQRLGDLVAISAGRDVLEYRTNSGTSRIMTEASQHSGLSPNEMQVPLLLV